MFDMPDSLAARIAGESKANTSLRDQLSRQLHVLQEGSETRQRFVGIRRLDIDNETQSDKVDNLESIDTPKASIDNNLCETERPPYRDMSVDIPLFSDTIHSDISQIINKPIPLDKSIPEKVVTESDYEHIAEQTTESIPSQPDVIKKSKNKKKKIKKSSVRTSAGSCETLYATSKIFSYLQYCEC
ncbi:hypothetical protein BDV35DRAFT_164277 [Aspergillus flavus]|uniref:Uncharacterized protein n=1 Tax=Aspergillus flavus TaxID=5059 RepID=A0A5N6GFG7_ASPFL|nr:hypothetical protein BDV35DRAFT_164277 [Aspergillus flavus]